MKPLFFMGINMFVLMTEHKTCLGNETDITAVTHGGAKDKIHKNMTFVFGVDTVTGTKASGTSRHAVAGRFSHSGTPRFKRSLPRDLLLGLQQPG